MPEKKSTKSTIYQKLFNLQNEIGIIIKDTKVAFKQVKYSFFNINDLIAELKPILKKEKLLILQPLSTDVFGKSSLKTIIIDIDTDEKIEYEVLLPELNDPQKMGSAITYFRRYSLQSLLSLQAEDDDGSGAKPKPANNQKTEIAELLKITNPLMETANEYKEECMKITKLELKEENFNEILSRLKINQII